MNILITGSSGLVGTSLREELAGTGHVITEYDARATQPKNILDKDALAEAMQGQDVVVHLAAIPHPDWRIQYEDYFVMNVNGTNNVASAAAEAGVKRFIYSSSTAYYGAQKRLPFNRNNIKENSINAVQYYTGKTMPDMDDPYVAADLNYSFSKVAAEAVLAAYGLGHRMEVIVLRMAPLIAKREPYAFGLLLYKELAAEAIHKAIELPGEYWYEVFNVQNPDAETLNIDKWTKLSGNLDIS